MTIAGGPGYKLPAVIVARAAVHDKRDSRFRVLFSGTGDDESENSGVSFYRIDLGAEFSTLSEFDMRP